MNKTKKIVFLINICHQGKPNKIDHEIKKKEQKKWNESEKAISFACKILVILF